MGKNTVKSNRRPRAPLPITSTRYSRKTLMHDRQYGFFWYAWLWQVLRPLFILVISLIVVMGIISMGVSTVNNIFFAATDPADEMIHPFIIERGTYIATIGKNLEEQGFIKSSSIFRYMVQFRELTEKIQFGTFPLSKNMSVNEVIDELARGSNANEVTITVIPGWTIKDINSYLTRMGIVRDEAEFLSLCNDGAAFDGTYFPIADALRSDGVNRRIYLLEGYLAPDTYRVYANATPQQILDTLLNQGAKVIDGVFNSDVDFEAMYNENGDMVDKDGNVLSEPPKQFETTLSHDQSVILASIIEKEAGAVNDYRRVSAVLHNRLADGMRLDCDSTINYALGQSKLILTKEELGTESPFNTYSVTGLPPGPICNPSERALIAARFPDMDYINGKYLYFCSKDPAESNELHFSKSIQEHNTAVAKYRPTWEAYEAAQREKAEKQNQQ